MKKLFLLLMSAAMLTFVSFGAAQKTAESKKATAKITLDGKLDEAVWATATKYTIDSVMGGESITDSADLYGFFQTLWSDSGIFVAVTVTDNVKGVTRPAETFGKSWNQDLVEVYFDMNSLWLADTLGPSVSGKGHFQNAPGNPIGTDTVVKGTFTSGIHYTGTTANYIQESFFAWKSLTNIGGAKYIPNKDVTLGFDVCIVDNDKDTLDKAKGFRNRKVWSNNKPASEDYSNMNAAGLITFPDAPGAAATAEKATAAIKIDGKLDDADWKTAAKVPVARIMNDASFGGGYNDCSAFFQTLWSDSGVFVAVTVTDDIKGVTRPAETFGKSWNQDLVEVYFDMNINNLKDGKGPSVSGKGHIQNAPGNPIGTDTLVAGTFTSGIHYTGTKANYIQEIFVPWKNITDSNSILFTNNKLPIGFDVCIVDNDKDTTDKAKGFRNRIVWSNNLSGSENYSNMNDAGRLTFSGAPILVPATTTAVKTTAAVKIDGVLDDADWKTATKVKLNKIMSGEQIKGGPTDLSAFFQTLWCDSGVFVAVSVTDDVKGVNRATAKPFGEAWNQDKVEVYFDMNVGKLKDGRGPGTSPPKGHYQSAPDNPYGKDTIIGKAGISYGTNGNYITEIFFPWKTLKDSANKMFTDNTLPVGFDVCIVDNDKDTLDKALGFRNRMIWSNNKGATEDYSNMNDAGRLLFSGIPVSVESLDGSSSGGTVALYPNPTVDQITLRTNIPGTLPVSIFNMSGQLVLSSTITDRGAIQVSSLEAGIYFVKIYNGKETFSAKFIKK